MSDEDDLLALDLEYRLTIAHRLDCECAPYFAERREVLIPAVLAQARESGEDVADTFAAFARKVHQRHGGGESEFTIGRYVALMASLGQNHPISPAEIERLVWEFGDHTNVYTLVDTVAELIYARLAPICALADEWANQPTDYDEDTEQQIADGLALRAALSAHESAPQADDGAGSRSCR